MKGFAFTRTCYQKLSNLNRLLIFRLHKALCAAVVKQDVLETLMLLFSGADVMCATGDPVYSTPYLLAKKAGQRLQMEFLYHNKFSGRIYLLYFDLLISY